ncbi:uncharacterized protein E5676_scaffold265G001560 [Cucumis melo var. makuwa]|uniref:Reverse transcriptase domain-containing protein n=1 Tax=Cucumis melo var. makuwa TaxID=1194695 RepID=A0A5D3C9N0_CUCMM|nr:uncharacterized protein E6C27_scaffold63G001610 [Cucumis melo var. makuwa]TYK08012.1 uncharacterized protein E5676_scaffold265G001560 [Cucumis melo var. makuwa]
MDDPNYCKYHRVIDHPVEKCFVLKELILRLAREKKIELDLEEDENPEVVACHVINATEEESIPPRSLEEEGVSKDLSRFNMDDLLSLPQETKTILINALLNSAASSSIAPTATYESTPYCMSIDFSDEDLLLGSKLHNRPLYVSGYVREQRVDRIFIDNGSTVNIMPKSTMRQLGILIDELLNSKLVIQGFNQGSQRVIDANFYLENDNSPEVVSVEIPLVNREDNIQLKSLTSKEPHKSTGTLNSRKGEASMSTTKSMILMDEKTSNPPILRYVPLSRCKKGESPFVESPQGLKVDGRRFDPKAYKLMAKAGYDFKTHTEFKSLKIHKQLELSLIQKKLLREGHAIPVSRKELGYKSQEPFRITRKGKEKVVDNNHITVDKVDSMEEKEGGSQRTSAFDQIRPHVARAPVKRHDIILTNPEKEDSKQGEGETSCHYITILEELEIETLEEDVEDAPQSLEDGGQSTIDELKKVNLGTKEKPRPTFISASLSSDEEGQYISLLTEYKDIFAWSYKKMPELDPKVAIYHLVIKPRYNQIRMAFSDEEMTAFRTPKGIYCYKVMPFGLINVGATYQRAMQKVFDDMLHKYVECYVDDLVVRFKRRQDHLKYLKVIFNRLRKYQLRMNPLKCAFGVTSRKFIGFIVRHRGIEINQSKIDAIQKMSRPKSLHGLKSLRDD